MRKIKESKKSIYLDNASTTPVDPLVLEEMNSFYSIHYANPSSIHRMGRNVKSQLKSARNSIAGILDCSPDEIIFTSGGTESNNIAIMGYAFSLLKNNRAGVFACSEIEHPAVIETIKATSSFGFAPRFIPVDKDGIIDLKELEKLLSLGNVEFVSVMYANNEIGTIQPIADISKLCHKHGAVFHTDACQASPYLDLNVMSLGVDMLSLNGSKAYGPKGIGALYIKKIVELRPITFGGGQEKGLRSGTENVSGIIGLSKALCIAQATRVVSSKRETILRDKLIKALLEIPSTFLNGDNNKRLPNNANISFLGVEGESLLLELDKAGVMVSTGSACSSKSLEPSRTIMAIHKHDDEPEAFAHSSIRFTIGKHTTESDIAYTVDTVKKGVDKLRSISSAW